jgi:hypothetical protein
MSPLREEQECSVKPLLSMQSSEVGALVTYSEANAPITDRCRGRASLMAASRLLPGDLRIVHTLPTRGEGGADLEER